MMNNNTIRDPQIIAAEIDAWDHRSVRRLGELLQELDAVLCERGDGTKSEDLVDPAVLPTADIPADLDTSYPIWAIDEAGKCLCGWSATGMDIQSVAEVREAQQCLR